MGMFYIGPESKWRKEPPYLSTAEVRAWWTSGGGDADLFCLTLLAMKGFPGSRPKFEPPEEKPPANKPQQKPPAPPAAPSDKPIAEEVLEDWSGAKVEEFREPI